MRKIKSRKKTKKKTKKYFYGKGNQNKSIRNNKINQSLLKVVYNNIKINGQNMLKNNTKIKPEINFNAETDVQYVLVMWDPDAPQSAWVHWIESYYKQNNVLQKIILLDYEGPNPPSGTHHYYFSLYKKDKKEEIKGIPDQRGYFNIREFELINKLEKVNEVYMTVSKN
jgi:phosphatidylethanolamine-binding protein (PEBP) family uncharacterized protein